MEKRIIVDMSFPKGNSVNDGIKKDEYLDEKICLTYLTVNNLVDIVRKKWLFTFQKGLVAFLQTNTCLPKGLQ